MEKKTSDADLQEFIEKRKIEIFQKMNKDRERKGQQKRAVCSQCISGDDYIQSQAEKEILKERKLKNIDAKKKATEAKRLLAAAERARKEQIKIEKDEEKKRKLALAKEMKEKAAEEKRQKKEEEKQRKEEERRKKEEEKKEKKNKAPAAAKKAMTIGAEIKALAEARPKRAATKKMYDSDWSSGESSFEESPPTRRRSTKKRKKDMRSFCAECEQDFPKRGEVKQYGCDECDRWYHPDCMPQDYIDTVVNSGSITEMPFVCNKCCK